MNQQAKLFENKFLEALTKSHPLLIWGAYIPILSFLLYRASLLIELTNIILLFFIAMLFWTIFEYVAHRFVFHWVSDNFKSKKFVYIIHGNHHEFPRDKSRLFMPLVPSLILSSSIFGIQYVLLGKYAFAFFPGFMLGYLLYASMHYAIHAFEPPLKFLRPLWRNHLMHHYKDEHLGFGVSNSIWDKVFGTSFDLREHTEDKEKEKSLKF
ncbi:MAG: fatty acid hydroxylase [Flavobacteriia bacterium]|nr:fatty acid hydroxylase [Flavobacteriia bacterium]